MRTLVEAFPEIVSARPGEMQIEKLPELRNLIVVDNADEHKDYLQNTDIKSVIDWREVLMWREDVREAEMQREIIQGQNKDEVINLQFTRCVFSLNFLCEAADDLLAGLLDYPRGYQ